MRLGFALPQVGSLAGPEALVRVAKRAEDLAFDSLWVLDRILWPVSPRAPYPIRRRFFTGSIQERARSRRHADVRRCAHQPHSLWQPVCSTFPGTIRFCWRGG